MKENEMNAASNSQNGDFINKTKDALRDNMFPEFRLNAHERIRFHAQSTRTKRSARSRNSRLSGTSVFRCVGSSRYSCRGRCSRNWDQGPIVARLQCFCDAFCESFLDCCADYDQFCSPPNFVTLRDEVVNSTHRVKPTTTVPQVHHSTKLLQANGPALFTSKNVTSQLSASAMQPLKSFMVSPSSSCKTICNTAEQTRATISSGIKGGQRHEAPDDRWKCVRDGHANESVGIWMLAVCPKNWPADMTRKQCEQSYSLSVENFNDMIPVSDQHGNNYKNRHCAKCNFARANELYTYELNVACMVIPPLHFSRSEALKFLFKYCPTKIKWKARDGKQRRYCNLIYSSCKETSPYYQNCKNGSYRIVYSTGKNYKNVFCAKCHNKKISKLTCGPKFRSPTDRGPFNKKFNVLLDVVDTSKSQVAVACPHETVYDVHLEICRRGRVQIPQIASFDRYRVIMWMIPSKRVIRRLNKPELLMSISFAFHLEAGNVIALKWNKAGDIFTVLLDIQFERNQTSIETESILEFTREVSIIVRNVSFTIFKLTSRLLTCAEIHKFSPSQYNVIVRNNTSMVFIKASKEILRQKVYYAEKTQIKDGVLVPEGNITICGKRLTRNCAGTYTLLEDTEYIIMPNGSVFRNVSKEVYSKEQYYIGLNNSVWICTSFVRIYWKEEKRDDELVFLAPLCIACLSISIVCLLIVLVTYCVFRELRTIPGIHLINLSISLLLAHFLWLLTTILDTSRTSCTVFAVFLHYFFLVSFTWMSVIAFDTWRAFCCKHWDRSRGVWYQMRGRVMRHTAVGWLPALFFVVICAALDQSNAVTIGYGGNTGCWVSNRVANLCIFTAPVALSLVFNVVYFVRTIKTIRQTQRQTQNIAERTQKRSDFPIFARIAALMGFSWIFGFLAMFISKYLWYPFAILTTLQGVYIATAFVFTAPRVRMLYCNLLIEKLNSNIVHSTGGANLRPPSNYLLTASAQTANDSGMPYHKTRTSSETQL